MAIEPGPADEPGARGGDTAKLRLGRARKRRPLVALVFALLGVGGLAVAGFQIDPQLKPRTFTVAQQRRIEAWEVARRWRVMPKARIFPAYVPYQVGGGQLGSGNPLRLMAKRIVIAPQAACAKAADAGADLLKMLDQQGCQALMRATYTDATESMVLTVGIAVLRNQASAAEVARYLTGGAPSLAGAVSKRLVLLPVHVNGTPAALFGTKQRQLSWVVGAGSYVVMATVGYADGRPRVPVTRDSYTDLEMTGLASGVADAVAAPFAVAPPVPHCPGALTAC